MLTRMLDAPIMVEPPIDTRLDVRAKDQTPREVLDMVVADVGAEWSDIPAIELLDWGGHRDASELGGDPVTLHLRGARLADVLTVLVSLEVDEAGVALEQVLAQVDLSYQHTTGFLISSP